MTVQLERRLPRPRVSQERPPVPFASVQEVLALDLASLRSPARPAPAGTRPAPGPPAEVEHLSRGFARALVEVLGGDRGPSQLLRWTTPAVYDQLQERARLLHRTVPSDRRVRRLASQVRSVHLARPSDRAVELAIHVRRGQRSMAVAARLEHRVVQQRDGAWATWLCTALEVG